MMRLGLICCSIFFLALIVSSHSTTNQKQIRIIKELTDGIYWKVIMEFQQQLFLVYPASKVDLSKLSQKEINEYFRQSSQIQEYPIILIDPIHEKVIGELTSNYLFPVAIMAVRRQQPDSWLVQEYDYWILDSTHDIAYALKPIRKTEWKLYKRYQSVDVVEVGKKSVKRTIKIPAITTIALSPDGSKLYVASGHPMDLGSDLPDQLRYPPGIVVVSTKTLNITKIIHILSDHAPEYMTFTKDGKYLICVSCRGFLVVDTEKDEPEQPFRSFQERGRIYHAYLTISDDRILTGLALSPDGKEFYVGLRLGMKKGGIIAIDIERKVELRRMELSEWGCTSVAVVGDKLFAACLDGVYVIDIPAWRKQQ